MSAAPNSTDPRDDLTEALQLFASVFGSPFAFVGESERNGRQTKNGDAVRQLVLDAGHEPTLTAGSYGNIARCGFNRGTLLAAVVATQIVVAQYPLTVRGVFYRLVSAGIYPDTRQSCYRQCQQVILKLRRVGILKFEWISDSTRRRLKPSSWSGLDDFAETVIAAYRRDLWAQQRDYIEFFVEKDAMAGVIEPVTEGYDVHLNIIRGQVSETFAWKIANDWRRIDKPIHVYYLGDHDPSGIEIEETLARKLRAFSERDVQWTRLAVTERQFRRRAILGFPVKRSGPRIKWRAYIRRFGDRCVEVDAIEPNEIRSLVKAAIESHIDQEQWRRLQETERLEKETVKDLVLARKPGIGAANAQK